MLSSINYLSLPAQFFIALFLLSFVFTVGKTADPACKKHVFANVSNHFLDKEVLHKFLSACF